MTTKGDVIREALRVLRDEMGEGDYFHSLPNAAGRALDALERERDEGCRMEDALHEAHEAELERAQNAERERDEAQAALEAFFAEYDGNSASMNGAPSPKTEALMRAALARVQPAEEPT